jgi:hypothetical protein
MSTTVNFARRVTTSRAEYARWFLLLFISAALGVLAFDRLTRPPPAPLAPAAVPPAAPHLPQATAAPRNEPAPRTLAPPAPDPPELDPAPAEPAPAANTDPASAPPVRSKRVAPGTRHRRAELEPARRRAAEESTVRAEAPLEPGPNPPDAAPEFGYLTIDSSPWSNVSTGGVSLGQTPVVRARLPSGTHTLVLTNPDQNLYTSYQVRIEPGKTTVRRVGLE